MSPWEFWLEFDRRVEDHRRSQTAQVGGKTVPAMALQSAQATARRLHKAKKEQREAAET